MHVVHRVAADDGRLVDTRANYLWSRPLQRLPQPMAGAPIAPIYSNPLMWRMLAPRDSTAPFSLHLDVTDVGRAIVVHAIVGAPVEAREQPLGLLDLI